MSALAGYGWLDRTAYWAWVAGMAMGGFFGVLLGRQLLLLQLRCAPLAWHEVRRWRRLRRLRGRRHPLRRLAAAYRELFRDVVYLCETGQLRPGR